MHAVCKYSRKDVQTQPVADTDYNDNILVAKLCTALKKIVRFLKEKTKGFGEVICSKESARYLHEKVGVIKCDSANVEVQWNNIKKCVIDTISDLVGKAKGIARKPWIKQEMIGKTNEQRKWKNVNDEEGWKNNRTEEGIKDSHRQGPEGIC